MSELSGAAGNGKSRKMRLPGPSARLGGGWQLPESHLLPDAVVAFVDGELSLGAHQRAAAHIARCTSCAAEVSAQHQARSAVHDADNPAAPAGLLDSLRSIPEEAELPSGPENLAVAEDGQVVMVQRQVGESGFGSARLGSRAPLGSKGGLTPGPPNSSHSTRGKR